MAALFEGITPFCSCSSMPLFIGFVKGGIPLGVTLTFLIASPLVSEIAVAMFLDSFGWKVTLAYIISGMVLSMAAGYILSRMHRAHCRGICVQGYSAWHCHCLYDGHYRPVHPRSHHVEKGDDLAIDRHLLRCGNTIDNHFRLFVQLDAVS